VPDVEPAFQACGTPLAWSGTVLLCAERYSGGERRSILLLRVAVALFPAGAGVLGLAAAGS